MDFNYNCSCIASLLNFSLFIAQRKFNMNVDITEVITYLKPKQKVSLESCVNNDSLIVLPTSYGKTLIYALLPFYVDESRHRSATKIVLIVPLNAILNEKVARLGSLMCQMKDVVHGNSECAQQQFVEGSFRYLIVHPEHFMGKAGFASLATVAWRSNVSHIVVDEAHCVVLWGCDFRIDFSRIRELRSIFPTSHIVGLTGTATTTMQSDIIATLGLRNVNRISMPVDRQNIKLIVVRRLPSTGRGLSSEDSYSAVLQNYFESLKEQQNQCPKTIIYLKLKWCGYAYHEALLGGIEHTQVAQYHASLPETVSRQK